MQTLFFISMAICTCGIIFEIQGLCIFYSLSLEWKHPEMLYGNQVLCAAACLSLSPGQSIAANG